MPSKRRRKLVARVTHLEMTGRPSASAPIPTRPRTALMQAENMPAHFYRYLYEQIGKAHHWFLRREMDDDDLLDIIQGGDTLVEVLYADGCPAGFFELSLADLPDRVEIVYFGLVPDFQGLGLGRWFLLSAVERAWSHGPEKVTVHTNSLDNPSALGLYQRVGFSPVAISEEEVTVWE
jgi:GNAT superfamily N-acetyltransferase